MTEKTTRSRNESNEDCVLTKRDRDDLEIEETEKNHLGEAQ